MFKTATLVFNPGSGKKQAGILAQQFADTWQAHFARKPLRLEASKSADHFASLAKQNYKAGNLLILMGGDGTFSLGLSALFAKTGKNPKLAMPVALLPAGSGNSFLRDFGVTDFETAQEKIITAILANRSKALDAARFSFSDAGKKKKRFFINIWALGLVSDINLLAMKLGKAYTLATLLRIPAHRRYAFDLVVDGQRIHRDANFISVSNSMYTGGAMLMAPMADTADGFLDAIVPQIQNRFALLGLFPKIFSGKHVESTDVEHFRFRKMEILLNKRAPVMIDGEMDYADSIILEALPKAWKLFI